MLRTKYDYIVGTDRRQFQMVEIMDMRNYSPDHFALQERILQHPAQCHSSYLWGGVNASPTNPKKGRTDKLHKNCVERPQDVLTNDKECM